ncbi:coniferyl aldehyde dehydrogenase [Craterilacuibacter sp.]|uniref:coniferyl aldehyde dehydrogenase n=1 Tax=Craterilacuibacter sp. TaxID=2870909 RepID=UPI003F325CB0
MNAHVGQLANPVIAEMLDCQRQAFIAEGHVSAAVRQDRLARLEAMLKKHAEALAKAQDADFGGRHPGFSLMNDVLAPLASVKHCHKMAGKWMKTQRRAGLIPFSLFGQKTELRYQPKGVVGIIGTWNAPVFTLISPLAYVLAAGNRAILKPSEIVPATAHALAVGIAEFFKPEEITVIEGGPEVADAITRLPLDHLVFTGSTAIGKKVMQNASANLTPVTLELGGKSPVIIGKSADLERAARHIALGKGNNSGQICVSPDTLYVHESRLDSLVAALKAEFIAQFPKISHNPDVTAVVNERHYQRVKAYVDEAREAGSRIETAGELPNDGSRRLPMAIVVNPAASLRISQEEIFGPALIVRSYRDVESVVASINAGAHPLALYYFGKDATEERYILDHTLSGGVAINEVMMHAALQDAPFGGVGASGMGSYHGREGFQQFSHLRSVYRAGWYDPRKAMGVLPPYNDKFMATIRKWVGA